MKKIIFFILLMIMSVKVYALDNKFYYDTERVEEMWIEKVSKEQKRTAHPYKLKRRSDNAYVYCIEGFIELKNDVQYTYNNDYTKYGLTKDEFDRINLIMYYGYGYKNHTTDKWYGVTQYLIWKITEKNADIYFVDNNKVRTNLYIEEINEIDNLIKEHNKEPDFLKEYVVLSNSSLDILSNIDLTNYEVISDINYDIVDNHIIFNNLKEGTYRIKLNNINNRYKSDYMLYKHINSQDIIVPGNYSILDKQYEFTIKVVKGTVNINKYDKDTKEDVFGAKYGIYKDNKLEAEIITDNNGYSQVKLDAGIYRIKEIEAPKYYLIDPKYYEFIIDDEHVEVSIKLEDEQINIGSLKIYKRNNITDDYLSGAIYGVYKDNELITTLVTDENGFASSELKLGTYKIKEIKAPDGYKLDNYEYEVILDKDNIDITLNLVDDKIIIQVPNTGVKYNYLFYIFSLIGIVLLWPKIKLHV